MSNKTEFLANEAAIRGIPVSECKSPTMPFDTYLKEVEELEVWARVDLPQLTANGMPPELVDCLTERIGAARFAEGEWEAVRWVKAEAQRQFAVLGPAGYELRDNIIHSMLFAYRKVPDVLQAVRSTAEGEGHADMIQDLATVSAIGKKNPGPLAAINFNMSLLDEAAQKSDELGTLLAQSGGAKAGDTEARVLRDQAFTYLKNAVDEIREYGQFVFWRNEERRVGYRSEYARQSKIKSQAKAAQAVQETTPTEES